MKQISLALNLSTRQTRKQVFLEQMEQVVPWQELVQLIAPTGLFQFGLNLLWCLLLTVLLGVFGPW